MAMQLTPKLRRNLSRIFPFGIIWLVNGWVFLFVEHAATGFENLTPSTSITVTFPILIFASIAVMLAGLLLGTIEIGYLEKQFSNYSLSRKIVYKLLCYLLFMLIILLITFPLAASIESGLSLLDQQIWTKMGRFLTSLTFQSTLVQLSFSMLLSLLYSAISENLGHQVLLNFFAGKYHKPIIEQRIFMFLDMKSSTTIAEKLGHVAYFDLLQRYFAAMSDPIINHHGEVYQYIGDEVVVSWKLEAGLRNNHCIRCFFAIKEKMHQQKEEFRKKFGAFPDFRAGIHCGEVTTGEIGALKKEIVFSGDILNATARIQGLCKVYEQDLLISEDLYRELPDKTSFHFIELGAADLRGKTQSLRLYAVAIPESI